MNSQRKLLKYRSENCLNCQQPLDKSETYCHHCGQLNSTKRLSFKDFFEEFFSGIFAYDSRLYRTLGALILRPGKISKDYIEGKRQRYANPFKFYLSVSILFFILWGSLTNFSKDQSDIEVEAEITSAIAADSLRIETVLNSLDPRLKDKTIEEVKLPQKELDTMGFWTASASKTEIFAKYFSETKNENPRTALAQLGYETSFFNRWLYSKTVDLFNFDADVFFHYMLGKLPFIIFFFLPVMALFIWLLYFRRPYTYMEHLIFTFHNQTVLFVLFALGLLIDYAFNTSWGMILTSCGFLVYLYKAMRRFYQQSGVKTFLKFLILNGLFLTLALIATAFSIIASFAIF